MVLKLNPQWPARYIAACKAVSGLDTKSYPKEAKRWKNYFKVLQNEIRRAKRGSIYIPKPDSRGFYPLMHNVPFELLSSAIRKNTGIKRRSLSWQKIANTAKPFPVPSSPPLKKPGEMTAEQKHSFLSAAAVALPVSKGRYPHYLGKLVPGELPRSGAVVPLSQISPEEWEKGGFTMRKFSLVTGLKSATKWVKRNPAPTAILAHGLLGTIVKVANESNIDIKDQHFLDAINNLTKEMQKTRKATSKDTIVKKYAAPVIVPLAAKLLKAAALRATLLKRFVKKGAAKGIKAGGTAAKIYPTKHKVLTTIAAKGAGGALGGLGGAGRWTRKYPGTAVGAAGLAGVSLRKKRTRYSRQEEIEAYWLNDFLGSVRNLWNKVIMSEPAQVAVRHATLGALQPIQQEIGLPPTTVDNIPLLRNSFKKELSPLSNLQIGGIIKQLENKAAEADVSSAIKRGLDKQIGTLATEVLMRRGTF